MPATVLYFRSVPQAFPFDAVRDLLGIARGLYASERDELVRDELKSIGSVLSKALFDAKRLPPESLGAKAALRHAEEACDRLGAIVAGDIARVVQAAAQRVRRVTGDG